MIVDWLLAVCVFWPITALYLGGMREVEGAGGLRQVLGLLLSFALFLTVWAVLRAVLGGFGGSPLGLVAATLATVLALPAVTWIGFRVVGARVVRSAPHAPH